MVMIPDRDALIVVPRLEQVPPAQPLRCYITSNPCGTDTWMVGEECKCVACQTWLVSTKTMRAALEHYHKLIGAVLGSLRSSDPGSSPRWQLAAATFDIGHVEAKALCGVFGWNADAKV